ncbi:hypothetical protein Asppvi_002006 [Aspergillus pseudoviridinutans]|uniref:Uncharacterized protein n=1 Tax=Aspergillus pseudoviridinutans TaxID=1517512 RepID=A0A9P3BPQ3_9EURO|nr:uncharacterized protein Asppvi_002006 [Aspergillus pseudoviridinutans]GIJ92728.1 hypothetical protein Asppvi_002006 [Aspergillus pseudoviridinutans]
MPKVIPSGPGIRSTPRKPESRSSNSNRRSVQRTEPPTCTPQQPPQPLRRASMLPQVSPVPLSQDTTVTPLEKNHKVCFDTVEALERENRALMRDKDVLSERIGGLEREKQKLLNDQHRLNDIQQFVEEFVARWQRLQGTADPPNNGDPMAMSTELPAATSVPGMWDTQEEGAGMFNSNDIVPGSENFTQLFSF